MKYSTSFDNVQLTIEIYIYILPLFTVIKKNGIFQKDIVNNIKLHPYFATQ